MTEFILTAMHLFTTDELFWIFFKGSLVFRAHKVICLTFVL